MRRYYKVRDVSVIKKVFPILGLSIFSSLLGAGIVAPLLPLYADGLGATGVWVGMIFGGFAISNAISTPIFGMLSDRSGRKILISIGLFLYSIISLGFVGAGTVSQLVLVRVLQGASGGMILPIAQAYIGDVCPEGEEGRWMGYANAAFFTGFGFGPFLGGILAEHFSMNIAFFSMSGLNFLAFLIVAIFLPEVSRRKSSMSARPSLAKLGASSMVRGLFSFRLTLALGRGSFITFLPIFAAVYLGLNPALTGVLLTVHLLLTSLLGILSGRVADRFNRRTLVIIGSLISAAYLALIPLTRGFWQILALCVFGSIGGAVALPAASALTVEEGRKFGMGSTIAAFSLAFSIGMAIGPILSGVIRDLAGINSVFYFAAVMILVGTGLFTSFTSGVPMKSDY